MTLLNSVGMLPVFQKRCRGSFPLIDYYESDAWIHTVSIRTDNTITNLRRINKINGKYNSKCYMTRYNSEWGFKNIVFMKEWRQL